MSDLANPTVKWSGSNDPAAPLVVLLHGRGSNEQEISSLFGYLPAGPVYAAVRAPISEGGGYAWFANRGIGRPVAESLEETTSWFRSWLDSVADFERPVIVIGFSGGAAFAGELLLQAPERYTGAAILYGTLPFDAGIPVTAGRLAASTSSSLKATTTPSFRVNCSIARGGTSPVTPVPRRCAIPAATASTQRHLTGSSPGSRTWPNRAASPDG